MTRDFLVALFLTVALLPRTVDAQAKSPTPTPNQEKVEKIEKAGGRVMNIAQNDDRIEVDFHLSDSRVTGDSLTCLEGLKNVYSLNLAKTNIDDAGLAHVKGLTTLNRLYLQETKITDKGLINLKGLSNLTYLNLYGTAITDQGVDQLTTLSNLKSLYLWQTKVTESGISKLKKSLPNVNVIMGWDQEQKK